MSKEVENTHALDIYLSTGCIFLDEPSILARHLLNKD